jgi:hypothetical protein
MSSAKFGDLWLSILLSSFPSMTKDKAIDLLAKQGGLAKALASSDPSPNNSNSNSNSNSTSNSNDRQTEIITWLNNVLKARKKIGAAINADQRKQPAVYSCFNPLFACLFSNNPTVLSLAARVVLALAQVIPPQYTYEVVTTAIDPVDPRRPNGMLLGILASMDKATSKSTRIKMCRFLTTICDMSSQRLRALLRTHLANAARSSPRGISLLHDVIRGVAELDANLKNVMVSANCHCCFEVVCL